MGLERIIYTGEVAAKLLGPGAVTIGQDSYESDLTKTFIQFTLMHSFPKGNLNGMTFLPPLLAKAVPTANNQPLNLDHQMEGNPESVYEGEDKIVGSMLRAYLADTGEMSLLPSEPIPVKIVGVLWNRSSLAQSIINSIGQGEKQYKTSFEVIRDVSEDGWVVKSDEGWAYQPQAEVGEELVESWKNGKYDNILLAVGGDGSGNSTNFWGGAFTLTPADPDAKINEVLSGCFAGQCPSHVNPCAIAAHIKSTEAKKEESTMAAVKSISLGESGFSVSVVGRQLSLTMGEETVKQPPDFYLSAYKMSDGDYALYASLTKEIPGENGFNQEVRLEYNPDSDTPSMEQVEEGSAKVKTPKMYEKQIAALAETIKNMPDEEKIRAEYTDHLSPDDHKKALDNAVAAALAEADKGNLFTEDQLKSKIDEAVQEALSNREIADTAAVTRGEKLVDAGFALTQERKSHIATFAVGEEGDKAFNAWIDQLKADQASMIKELEKAGIEVDDNIKSALAHINSVKDSGFGALIASRGHDNSPPFTPSMESSGDEAGTGSTPKAIF